jgi:hypothetical protein
MKAYEITLLSAYVSLCLSVCVSFCVCPCVFVSPIIVYVYETYEITLLSASLCGPPNVFLFIVVRFVYKESRQLVLPRISC